MLVSIAPHRAFVEAIAGDTVDVDVIVPAGASSHSFEPTPKQMTQVSKAEVWFQVGESFETKLSEVIKSYAPSMKLVNLWESVDMICVDSSHAHHQCSHNFQDIHIWLSPKEAKTQAKTIAVALSELYPQHKELYEARLHQFLRELDQLDVDIRKQLANCNTKIMLVSHPAYAYFARDYGLQQLSIEFEGRDPSPQQLTKVVKQAKDSGVKTIFIQPQHSNKGAHLIAKHINAEVVSIDPYSEDYLENMRFIAKKVFCEESSR